MKTPREILLSRHQAAQTKLDRIRQNAVAEMTRQETSAEDRPSPRELPLLTAAALKLWRELILPSRRIWAGLAAVWVALAIFNFSQAGGPETVVAKTTVPAPEVRLAFREQQQLLAEILGPSQAAAPAEPPRRSPQPRSERQTGWRISTVGDEGTRFKCQCA